MVEGEGVRKKWGKGGEVCSKLGCSKGGRRERRKGEEEGRERGEVWHLCRNDSIGRDDREILMALVEKL